MMINLEAFLKEFLKAFKIYLAMSRNYHNFSNSNNLINNHNNSNLYNKMIDNRTKLIKIKLSMIRIKRISPLT